MWPADNCATTGHGHTVAGGRRLWPCIVSIYKFGFINTATPENHFFLRYGPRRIQFKQREYCSAWMLDCRAFAGSVGPVSWALNKSSCQYF